MCGWRWRWVRRPCSLSAASYENRDPIAQMRDALDNADQRRARHVRLAMAVGAAALLLVGGLAAVGFAVARGDDAAAPVQTAALAIPAAESETRSEPTPIPEPEPDPAPAPPVEPAPSPAKPEAEAAPKPAHQRLSVSIGDVGYVPDTILARAGAPIELTVGKGVGCAAGFLMPDLGVSADNSSGDVTVQLPALGPGTYAFTCGMGMVSGQLIVK